MQKLPIRPNVRGAIISHACLRKLIYSNRAWNYSYRILDDAAWGLFYDPLSINIMQIGNNVHSN